MLDLDKIGQDIENLTSELELDEWENKVGLKDERNTTAIREKYSHLATKHLFEQIARERQTAKGELARRLKYTAEKVGTSFLDFHVKELSDKADTIQTKGTIQVSSTEFVPFRQLLPMIQNESNRPERAAYYYSRNNFIARKVNPVLIQRMHGLHTAAVSLGYPSYTQMYQDLKGVDLNELFKQFELLIEQTDDIYYSRMNERMKNSAGVELKNAEKHDLHFVFRTKQFDQYFPKEKLVETLKKTLIGLGIDLEKLPNVNLDLEEREKKHPRAFTSLVRVPSDVRLVIKPQGGVNDYRGFLHEFGHTGHLSYVNPSLPPEYKVLGDISVTETYAGLFETLVQDPNWLQKMLEIKDTKPVLDSQIFQRLYMARRYGAKLGYEIQLHRKKDLEEMPERYKQALERALVFKHSAADFLIDVDDAFYAVYYLRSMILEAQLKDYLKRNFGERWWENPESGAYLKGLWSLGQKYDANELAQRLGYSGLDIHPVIADFKSYFS
jgi:hypothetical protein